MAVDKGYPSEAEALFQRWLERTEQILKGEMRRLEVRDSGDLRRGLRARLEKDGRILKGELSFLLRGRFVDMGAGRWQRAHEFSRRRKGGRQPKKWYSPAFYGRLDSLMGALGIEMMEEAMEKATQELKQDG